MDKRIGRFERYVLVICMLMVIAFLLQLGIDTFKLSSPTGAVTMVYDLNDALVEIVGGPASSTKIVTGAAPTDTESRIANYLASNYVFCGDGAVNYEEDCEPEFIPDLNAQQEGVYLGIKCVSCRAIGDGRIDHLDTSTGLMESCDPGNLDFIPIIPAMNTCTNNGQCGKNGNCPSGSKSTSLCAYGLYKDMLVDSTVYEYQPADGNLWCEEDEESSKVDCVYDRMVCGVTVKDVLRMDIGDQVDTMTDAELGSMISQEYGVSRLVAEAMLNSFTITIPYVESGMSSYVMTIIKFADSDDLQAYVSYRSIGAVNVNVELYNVYVSNSVNEWMWHVDDILFVLGYYQGTTMLTLQEKQEGNTILMDYLTRFGSDVSADLMYPLPGCGNMITESGEECDDGNTITTDACIDCQDAFCGDGYVQAGVEECDDANLNDNDACVNCKNAVCGDGYTYYGGGEECDDGNYVNNDGCSSRCTLEQATCGDIVCERIKGENNANCPQDCVPICGNHVIETGEECDDGNLQSGDGCDITCQSEPFCGNNICDANENPNNCDNDCAVDVCGNNLCETGEDINNCAQDCGGWL